MVNRIRKLTLLTTAFIPLALLATDIRAEEALGDVSSAYDCSMVHNGYFMLPRPGCRSFTIGGTASRIDDSSSPAIGTYSPNVALSIEQGIAKGLSAFVRYGYELEYEQAIDTDIDFGLSDRYNIGLSFKPKWVYARGEYNFSGTAATNTVNSRVGLTYNQNIGTNSGVGSDAYGFSVNANGQSNNTWNRLDLTLGTHLVPDEDRPTNSFTFEISPYWERYRYNSSGSAELLFGGNRFGTGITQNYHLDTADDWYGVSLEARQYVIPNKNKNSVFDFGVRLDLSYHQGSGNFQQVTNNLGAIVNQSLNWNNDGFSIGGGFTIGCEQLFHMAEDKSDLPWRVRWEGDASILSNVTGFDGRESPLDQAGHFERRNPLRLSTSLRISRNF